MGCVSMCKFIVFLSICCSSCGVCMFVVRLAWLCMQISDVMKGSICL